MSKSRYKVWDKKTPLIGLAGECKTYEELVKEMPALAIPQVQFMCFNRFDSWSHFQEFNSFINNSRSQGADIPEYDEDTIYQYPEKMQELLDMVEAFEDQREADAIAYQQMKETEVTPTERVAAALELQCMLSMMSFGEEE